jgi:hypothetical protein
VLFQLEDIDLTAFEKFKFFERRDGLVRLTVGRSVVHAGAIAQANCNVLKIIWCQGNAALVESWSCQLRLQGDVSVRQVSNSGISNPSALLQHLLTLIS